MNNTPLHQYLNGGCVETLETKLGLKENKGFPNFSNMQKEFSFKSREEFDSFLSYCENSNSLISKMGSVKSTINYKSYIILYKNIYFVQVNKHRISKLESRKTGKFNNYLDALIFIEKEIFDKYYKN